MSSSSSCCISFRSGWTIRTCLSTSSAWCSTWSSWAWTTRSKKAKRTRFGVRSCSLSLSRCAVSDKAASLLGALHWGALPRQLVPGNQSPLQPAPCHQLCQSAGPRDGARGEEGGSAQHQHRGLFLRPGKLYRTAASIHHNSVIALRRRSKNKAELFFESTTSPLSFMHFLPKKMHVFNSGYSRELQGRCFLPHLLWCRFVLQRPMDQHLSDQVGFLLLQSV